LGAPRETADHRDDGLLKKMRAGAHRPAFLSTALFEVSHNYQAVAGC
jgi:hypothetical protein